MQKVVLTIQATERDNRTTPTERTACRMNKPTSWGNSPDYAVYYEAHRDEILKSALDAIQPDFMGMDRQQALTLAGAMKNCGFTSADFADVMARSSADKGTFAKQWERGKISGKGGNGRPDPGEGTIIKYAQKCGWKRPALEGMPTKTTAPAQVKKTPALMAKYTDDFKIVCIMDSQEYASKPAKREAQTIRSREKVPTPPPVPMALADFARAITSGRTFSPTVYSKEQNGINEDTGKPRYNYRAICQQVFVVDIDNEEAVLDESGRPVKDKNGKQKKKRIDNPLTIERALQICELNEVQPFMVYETFSSKDHRNDPEAPYTKFRLCFATDKPLTVQEYGERGIGQVISYFIGLFGLSADQTTTDSARLIYGTDEKDSAKLYKHVIDSRKLAEKLLKSEAPAEEEPETIQPRSAADYLADFRQKIKDSASNPPISTGFANLDGLLDGGLYAGLYFIGAISSLGKTTFTLQIADNLAKQGQDVLILSLEMARDELIAKSISRLTFLAASERRNAKTTRSILSKYDKCNQTEKDLIDGAIASYAEYAQHIYIEEGIGDIGVEDIKERVKQHIAYTGNKPVIVIDYAQILATYDTHLSDKQATDRNVTELKRLSRDYNIPVIAISSFNRDNYSEPLNLTAFKESGSIEYSSDTLIGLQYEGMDYCDEDKDDKTRRKRIRKLLNEVSVLGKEGEGIPVQLKVLKNRNGSKGNVSYNFYAMFNYFCENDGFIPAPEGMEDIFKDIRNQKAK